MKRIHDDDALYSFLLPYINRSFRRSYREVEYCNLSRIPSDGAIIFAPNHANTLMDALAVLSIDNGKKVFVARADIFKNKTAAKILSFLKILPINRIRDGVEALKENEEITQKCVDALVDKVPFCILPEGRHRTMHSLLPLRKGIVRIAFETWKRVQDQFPVYIVPVGLEYEDYYEFRSRLLVNIAEPILLQDFARENEGATEAELSRKLLLELSERLRGAIICLPDDERYAALWETASVLYSRGRHREGGQYGRLRWMQRIVARLAKRNPNIRRRAALRAQQRAEAGVTLGAVTRGTSVWGIVLNALILLLLLPVAAVSAFAILPALIVIGIIKPGLQDKAFLNSIRYVALWLVNPVIMLLAAIVTAFFCWSVAIALAVLPFIAPIIFYDYANGVSHCFEDIKYRRLLRNKKN